MALLELRRRPRASLPPAPSSCPHPSVEPADRGVRGVLYAQLAQLDGELAALSAVEPKLARAHRRTGVCAASSPGPRLLGLREIQARRDELAERSAGLALALTGLRERQAANRALLERALAEPRRHRGLVLTPEDLGRGAPCQLWYVGPRCGLLGRLLGWWRVKISSGCP